VGTEPPVPAAATAVPSSCLRLPAMADASVRVGCPRFRRRTSAPAANAMPTDVELEGEIKEVLRGSDLTKMSLKEVRGELERRFRLTPGSLDGCREKLKELVAAEIARIQEAEEEGDGDGEADGDEEAAEAEVEAEASGVAAAGERLSPKEEAGRASKGSKDREAGKKKTSGQKRPREGEEAVAQGEGGGKAAPGKGNRKERQAASMTRKEFMKKAKTFSVELGDRKLQVASKQFSTGSCGFFGMGKVTLQVGEQPLTLQCQINCTVIGSKQWKDE